MTGNIINLVRRDFDALMSEKIMWFIIQISFWLSVMFASLVNYISLLSLCLFIYIYIKSIFSLDEKYRIEKYYASLPVRRSEIVLSRYGGVVVISAIYLLIANLVNRVFIFFNFSLGVEKTQPLPADYIILVFLILSFFTSLTFPFYFRFGIAKAKWISMILFIVYAGLTSIIISRPMIKGTDLAKHLDFLFMQEIITSLILAVCAVVLLAVSIPVTLTLYSKKDL